MQVLCYNICLGFGEVQMVSWETDFAAGSLTLKEAGGRAADFQILQSLLS